MSEKPPPQRTWGGRFGDAPAALMREINASIRFDKRLWREDIAASNAHAAMLREQGIISEADAAAILEGLDIIAGEYERDGVPENSELEDIHMTVEHRLGELIGEAAGRLHTARSRNDQVATDFRLWVRNACDEAADAIRGLQRVLVERAEEHADTVMPGFTHLQVAQPVTLGHHLLAYYEMLRRDLSRFADARARMNESPLGVAPRWPAPASRSTATRTADALGFDRPTANSLDAVSDRDFALDYLSAAAQCALHLSRLAEELILWASQQFGFVKLSDEYSTGSSIMPQKRNPDAAELVRGHSGRIIGALVSLMVTMKGLPLAYSKDMQDDKEPVFEARDLLMISLAGAGRDDRDGRVRARADARGRRSGLLDRDRSRRLAGAQGGVPFREAHHITGRAVKLAEERGCGLAELSLDDLKSIDPRIDERVFSRAQRRSVGRQPHELRRHGADPRARADCGGEGSARTLSGGRAARASAAAARSA